jgi:hypothetical protein
MGPSCKSFGAERSAVRVSSSAGASSPEPRKTQTVLDRNLDSYNHRRAHQGYRTRGRTPGEIFMHRTRHDSQPKKP